MKKYSIVVHEREKLLYIVSFLRPIVTRSLEEAIVIITTPTISIINCSNLYNAQTTPECSQTSSLFYLQLILLFYLLFLLSLDVRASLSTGLDKGSILMSLSTHLEQSSTKAPCVFIFAFISRATLG